MSTRRREWISKRGQTDVAGAIDQVLDRQPGEHVQQLDDTQIEDSPFQARRPFSGASVEDLAQGMREMGFQGVLIVRPHGELAERRRGLYQLVYGHRRRAAWRHVCAERGERCALPVVIREVSDERMLTIGAQENLQREDLDPIEEAQIVAWHQRIFSDRNQAEIGAMLGKSSDWVSVRARISKLPEALKERLRLRPRAISQILELSTLADEHPTEALVVADRIVAENLTLEAVRTLLRGYVRPARGSRRVREAEHNRRGAATSVQEITNGVSEISVVCDTSHTSARQPVTTNHPVVDSPASAQVLSLPGSDKHSLLEQSPNTARRDADAESSDSLTLLRNAATALATIAARSNDLPLSTSASLALDQAERALAQVRSVLTHSAMTQTVPTSTEYQLVETDLHEILVRLLGHQPIKAALRCGQPPSRAMHVVMFIMPRAASNMKMAQTSPGDLFIAVGGAGHGVVPLTLGIPMERVRNSLGLVQEVAVALTALINDLARVEAVLR
jgi:ParB family transcriptional regulator, chromosome partitioning protein